jgi:phosphohistidine phosphatase
MAICSLMPVSNFERISEVRNVKRKVNMNLYIVRHAIAAPRGTPGYEDDSQRPLTDDGRKKMKKIVKALSSLKLELDTILSSPYVRALDTAKILAKEFTGKDKIALSDNLIPPGNFENLVQEIHDQYDVNNLALVGHEPMLSSLVSWLTTGNTELRLTLKKGGVAYLSTGNLYQDRRATLEWLLTPALMLELQQ